MFAQRRNLLRPAFWRMLADLLRFNRLATALAVDTTGPGLAALDQPIGEFLDAHRFSPQFRDWYLLPMIGCIWSCPTDQMLRFPVATMIRFCHNHGLLQVADRPQWHTVRGGARNYVVADAASRSATPGCDTPVRRVRRLAEGGVEVATDGGTERFDAVVLACHSDQSLALLADPSDAERAVLGAIRYHPNRAVLHTDASVLPRRRKAWAAWNYARAARRRARERIGLPALPAQPPAAAAVHDAGDRLAQSDRRPGAGSTVHGSFDYAHPVFDAAAIAAQGRLPDLQGRRDTWFCGAWTGYGFHEDGLRLRPGRGAPMLTAERRDPAGAGRREGEAA